MTEMSECDRGLSVKRRGHVRLDWTRGDKPRYGSSSSLFIDPPVATTLMCKI